MKIKIIAALVAVTLLAACKEDLRVPAQASAPAPTTTSDDSSSYGGFGMSYGGRMGVSLGNGLVITGKGLEFGFGF